MPGSDDRLTIVFLHGTRMSGAEWATQAAALADEFHVLTPDLAGHGSAASTPFTLAAAADRVAALIRAEAHGGRAVVVGLSLGGYVAMELAARDPELIQGLVVSGATAEPVGRRALPYRGLALVFDRVPERVLVAANGRYLRWRYPRAAEPILAAGLSFRAGAVALRSLVGEEFRPRLAAYPGPSLLLNGELDVVFRPSEASFARVAANPRRVVIRRATHLAHLDRPAAFTAAVRRFARSVGGPMVSSADRPNPS